jgi:hypothetical protein
VWICHQRLARTTQRAYLMRHAEAAVRHDVDEDLRGHRRVPHEQRVRAAPHHLAGERAHLHLGHHVVCK